MKTLIRFSQLLIIIAFFGCIKLSKQNAVLYQNGYIYNGKGFEKKDFIVEKGIFFFNDFIKPYKVIDLMCKKQLLLV